MNYLDVTLPSIVENLALDEALLDEAEAGGPEVLRLWEWPTPAVVLGAGGRIAEDVHVDACEADGVPIARRSSGGGTVLLGRGCLLFGLILRFDRHPALGELHPSYRFILDSIRHAVDANLTMEGSSDLARAGRKISGNAQQRKRTHLLHHGSLLYAFDAGPLMRFLKMPARRPDYRLDRSHADFVANLAIEPDRLRKSLRQAWDADEESTLPVDRVRQLVSEKFGRSDWVFRR